MATIEQKKTAAFAAVPETDRSRLIAARRHGQALPKDSAVRERESDLGGMRLQMYVNWTIPGYHGYWANDEDGYVESLLMDGFDFVTQDELYQGKAVVVPDLDISSCVSKFVKGTRSDGQALRAYLMKIPEEQWKVREDRRHAAADKRDREIHRKATDPNRADGFYRPDSVNTTIDTGYRKEYGVKNL
jgi:hypothetical protein